MSNSGREVGRDNWQAIKSFGTICRLDLTPVKAGSAYVQDFGDS